MELFNNVESDVTVTYKVFPYLDRSSEDDDNEGSWEFKQEPTISDQIKISTGEKTQCFSITLPKSSPSPSRSDHEVKRTEVPEVGEILLRQRARNRASGRRSDRNRHQPPLHGIGSIGSDSLHWHSWAHAVGAEAAGAP